MKSKSVIVIIWLIVSFSSFGQTIEYIRFHLSVRIDIDFPWDTSDTPGVDPDFILPFAKKGFGATVDGAYFFTKNTELT